MWTARGARTVLIMLALCRRWPRADEPHKPPPEDPDPGFLEFLGSVDRHGGSQSGLPVAARPADSPAPGIKPPPPPPPPPRPPPPPNAAGDKNND